MTEENAERYDRQLRLWGSHGQLRLAKASVLCIGSSAVGTEVLKDLVLPGIGSVTVVDDAIVVARDLGQNFFVESSDIGKYRAEVVLNRLLEMNPFVKGTWLARLDITSDISQYDVVVTCNRNAAQVRGRLYTVVVESTGFIGRVRIYASMPHVVLEPKDEEGRIDDLRICNPWKELTAWVDSFDFSAQCEEIDLFHIPWLAILIKAAAGILSGAKDRKSLSDAVRRLQAGRTSGQNFQEAIDNIYRVTAVTSDADIIDAITVVVQRYGARSGPAELADTVVVLRAVLRFYKEYQALPLFGSALPDMTSRTDSYTSLVGLFRDKWTSDLNQVTQMCERSVDPTLLQTVIANLRNIRVMEFPNLPECELPSSTSPKPKRHNGSGIFSGYPDIDDPDQVELVRILDGESVDSQSRMVREFERYKPDVELHSISAVIGSVAAQDIVKLITKQFVPIDNAFVFNGVNGTAFTYRTLGCE